MLNLGRELLKFFLPLYLNRPVAIAILELSDLLMPLVTDLLTLLGLTLSLFDHFVE